DDRAFEYGRVGGDRLLDFDAGDVLAARDDDVLAAVAELDVAVGMPDGKVPGMEPAPGERLGGGRLVVEVAAHDVVPAHDHLAHHLPVLGDVGHLLVDDPDQIGGGIGLPLTGQVFRALVHRELAPGFLLGAHGDRPVGLGQAVH